MLNRVMTPRERIEAICIEECDKENVNMVQVRSRLITKELFSVRVKIARRLNSELCLNPTSIGKVINRERTTIIYYINDRNRTRKHSASRARYHCLKAVREALA